MTDKICNSSAVIKKRIFKKWIPLKVVQFFVQSFLLVVSVFWNPLYVQCILWFWSILLTCMYVHIHSPSYLFVWVCVAWCFCVSALCCRHTMQCVCVCTDVGLKMTYYYLKAVESLACCQGNHFVRNLVSLSSSAIFECLDWLLVL